jgi:signal transduction histidine kinase
MSHHRSIRRQRSTRPTNVLTTDQISTHVLAQEARESAELIAAQNRVLELVARGVPLHHALDVLLQEIEAQTPGTLLSILLLDPDGVHVRHGAAPSLPDSYVRAIDGETIGPRAGSCGTAAYRGEPVIVEDIATDPLWESYREVALAHDLHACWSTPIFDGDHRVLGTFALYFHTPARPTPRHYRVIGATTYTAAIAIVTNRESEETARREAQFTEAERIAQLGSYDWDVRSNTVRRSAELCRIFGLQPEAFPATFDTDRKRVEEQLQRSEELRVRNEELKSFAYMVSHDLKAPLRGISGYARELERQHRDRLDERAAHCVDAIVGATQNLDRRIEDLLHYSRLDAETPTETDVDVVGLVDDILADHRAAIATHGTEVSIDLAVPQVRTWKRGLRQVLANLIDNAIKFSKGSQPPRVRISSEGAADSVRIVVVDNGIGFDMAHRERIFGLFNRPVGREQFDGTGAGLAIVRKVAERMGARVSANSVAEAGATFVFDLPAAGSRAHA